MIPANARKPGKTPPRQPSQEILTGHGPVLWFGHARDVCPPPPPDDLITFPMTLSPLLLHAIAVLSTAFVLGTLIGAERQYRNRSAGLRTNVLVAVGAAAFVELGARLNGAAGAVHIAAYVVSGIGFLGAGAILRDGATVKGINTAATLWASAAVGALCGANLLAEAVVLTVFVLAGNTLLRPIVNGINRLPFNERTSEARYQVHVTTTRDGVNAVRDEMANALEAARYPAQSIRVYSRDERYVEVIATLLATAVDPRDLDRFTDAFAKRPTVVYATWSQRTMD